MPFRCRVSRGHCPYWRVNPHPRERPWDELGGDTHRGQQPCRKVSAAYRMTYNLVTTSAQDQLVNNEERRFWPNPARKRVACLKQKCSNKAMDSKSQKFYTAFFFPLARLYNWIWLNWTLCQVLCSVLLKPKDYFGGGSHVCVFTFPVLHTNYLMVIRMHSSFSKGYSQLMVRQNMYLDAFIMHHMLFLSQRCLHN